MSKETDHVFALLRYHGFIRPGTDEPRQPDYRSRAKREGKYLGWWRGRHWRGPEWDQDHYDRLQRARGGDHG